MLENIKKREIVIMIIGDLMLDQYLYGSVDRISPEAPIPVVSIKQTEVMLGGAANAARNARALGVKVKLAGVLGEDTNGKKCVDLLEQEDISYWGIVSEQRPTTIKTRIIGKNQQIVRYDEEKTDGITNKEENELLKRIKSTIGECDVIIISDYSKGTCTKKLLSEVIQEAKKREILVVADPKGIDWEKYIGVDILTPNVKELGEAIGGKIENEESVIVDISRKIMSKQNLSALLVTRSEKGMTYISDNDYFTFPALQRSVFDVSGAGDTAIATLAVFMGAGYDVRSSVELANEAAGISVGNSGTYAVSLDELMKYHKFLHSGQDSKVLSKESLTSWVDIWKKQGKKIVFTNGCFDILHAGHVDYLQKAAKMGDILIVGVNSDSSVRKLKGDDRPVNTQNDRITVLSAMSCIDKIVMFETDTPLELIEILRPDVLVKGGDYKTEDIVGKEYAGETVTIPFVKDHSTSNLIRKIKGI